VSPLLINDGTLAAFTRQPQIRGIAEITAHTNALVTVGKKSIRE
jgi:hypothetical protein